jgi:cation transport ATPase
MVVSVLTVAAWLLLGGAGVAVRALAAGVSVLISRARARWGLAVPTAVMVATVVGGEAGRAV